ncbi:MAG: DnaJ domain-containing protein [Deltaproteobacteria bacterium]|nr:DnaJ domain-containing protein [Deltaproteobacteria bacterium]
MEYVDYYVTLGAKRDASQDELAKAYKRLARKYHPDLNKAEGAEAKFKELNEAYEVLKDPDTRKRYDALGANWKHGAPFEPPPGWGGNGNGGGGRRWEFSGGGQPGASGFSDFFETLFSSGGMGGMGGMGGRGRARRGGAFRSEDLFGGFGAPPPQRGRDVETSLKVSLEDIYKGSKQTVTLSFGGERKKYDITIPKHIRHGEKMRLGGQGAVGQNGQRGDLFLEIQLQTDPRFRVEGDDLVATLEVPAWDAALGSKVLVTTLENEVTMTVPAGVSCGQRMRLRGKGLGKKGGSKRGDLYMEIKVVVPKKISPEERELFEKLRELQE